MIVDVIFLVFKMSPITRDKTKTSSSAAKRWRQSRTDASQQETFDVYNLICDMHVLM